MVWGDEWSAVGESVHRENVLAPLVRDGKTVDTWWTYSFAPAFDDRGAIGGVLVVCTENGRNAPPSAPRVALRRRRRRRQP